MEKKLYRTPEAKDLTGYSVQGGPPSPQGWCSNGTAPSVNSCTSGVSPTQDPALCFPFGSIPDPAGCLNGTNVLSFCTTGSFVPITWANLCGYLKSLSYRTDRVKLVTTKFFRIVFLPDILTKLVGWVCSWMVMISNIALMVLMWFIHPYSSKTISMRFGSWRWRNSLL